MKQIAAAFCFFFLALESWAATPPPVTEQYGTAPDGSILNWIRYAPDPVAFGSGPFPSVILIHGGGFLRNGPDSVHNQVVAAQACAAAGYEALSIWYRLAPPGDTNEDKLPGQTAPGYAPLQYNDCKVAVKAARTKSWSNGQVASMGGSAGATHTIWLCADTRTEVLEDATHTTWDASKRPLGGVAFSPAVKFDDWVSTAGTIGAFAQNVTNYVNIPNTYPTLPGGADLIKLQVNSPISVITSGINPIFSSMSTNDDMPKDQEDDLEAALIAAGATNYESLKAMQGSIHSWQQWTVPLNNTTTETGGQHAMKFLAQLFAPTKPLPAGVVHLFGGSALFCDKLVISDSLTKPFIDGFRGRIAWDVIQPTSATDYDWSCIDEALAACNASGKFLTLSVIAGTQTPGWVFTSPPTCTAFPCDNDGDGINEETMPLPFEANYLAKWKTFVAAFAARYDNNPALRAVFYTGEGQQIIEYHVTGTTENFDRWRLAALAAGYVDGTLKAEDQALRFGTTEVMNAFKLGFQNTVLIATGGNPWGGGANGVADETAMNAQSSSTRSGQSDSTLKATLSHTDTPNLKTYPWGEQAIFASTDHNRFYTAPTPSPWPTPAKPAEDLLRNGYDKGNQYVEVYEYDIGGSGVPGANDAVFATQRLRLISNLPGGAPPPTPTPTATPTPTPTPPPAKWPVGFFARIANPPVLSTDTLLSRDYVAGYRLNLTLLDIKPDTTGTPVVDEAAFDWSLIDDSLAIAVANGKKLGISVAIGRTSPNWLFALGAYSFTIDPSDNQVAGQQFRQPLVWDSVYRTYLFRFIDAFAARYDGNPSISYVMATGFMQDVQNSMIHNVDASVTVTDATTSTSGSFGKVVSAQADFLTRVGASTIVGKALFDNPGDNAGLVFRDQNVVCNIATTPACPADPTDDTVYFKNGINIAGSSKVAHIGNWLTGQGDESKADTHAISSGFSDVPPAFNEVLFGKTWTPCNGAGCVPSVSTGFASTRAYISTAEALIDRWTAKFVNTPLILTNGVPFSNSNPWVQTTASVIKQYITAKPHGGFMTEDLNAICTIDYTGIRKRINFPQGDKSVAPLTNANIYHGGKCRDGSSAPPFGAQRVLDLCEAAWENGDYYLEPDYDDLASPDTAIQDAWTSQAGRFIAPGPTPPPTLLPTKLLRVAP